MKLRLKKKKLFSVTEAPCIPDLDSSCGCICLIAQWAHQVTSRPISADFTFSALKPLPHGRGSFSRDPEPPHFLRDKRGKLASRAFRLNSFLARLLRIAPAGTFERLALMRQIFS